MATDYVQLKGAELDALVEQGDEGAACEKQRRKDKKAAASQKWKAENLSELTPTEPRTPEGQEKRETAQEMMKLSRMTLEWLSRDTSNPKWYAALEELQRRDAKRTNRSKKLKRLK